MLLDLRALLEARGAGRDDERRLPARAELAVDGRDDDVDLGDAAVRHPGLLAVEDPLVLGLVVLARSCAAPRRRSRRRARTRRTRATFGSSAVPKHCGIHSPICSGVPEPKIPATASVVPMIAMPMPASPQKSSSLAIGTEAGRVGPVLGDRLEAVEADLRGLLDDRPGGLLALVPLGGGGADDALGEAVGPVADVALVLGELERERRLVAAGGERLLDCCLSVADFHGSPSSYLVRAPRVVRSEAGPRRAKR